MTGKPTKFNDHAHQRIAQRNLSAKAVQYVITHGKRMRRAGAVFYYLRKCDLATDDHKNDALVRLVGTAVVLSPDERTVLTVWRNRRNGLNHIQRKPKYAIPHWMRQTA